MEILAMVEPLLRQGVGVNYLMKKTIILFLLLSFVPSTALASDVDKVVDSVMGTKPPDWQIHIDATKHPPWARSDEKCVELEMYGPALGGYAYYNSSGEKISERKFSHEAIILWITPKGYNSGWNFFTRLLNWFSPWAIGFPRRIGGYNGVKVYGEETYYADSEKINEDSPEGTVSAKFFPPSSGRTWQAWRDDVKKAIEKMTPTTP